MCGSVVKMRSHDTKRKEEEDLMEGRNLGEGGIDRLLGQEVTAQSQSPAWPGLLSPPIS